MIKFILKTIVLYAVIVAALLSAAYLVAGVLLQGDWKIVNEFISKAVLRW